jgi:hypothetical protein
MKTLQMKPDAVTYRGALAMFEDREWFEHCVRLKWTPAVSAECAVSDAYLIARKDCEWLAAQLSRAQK